MSNTTRASACSHVIPAKSESGELLGSWKESNGRIECACCQKHYEENESERVMAEYRRQQQRLSCPGCGESPFLG